MSMKKKKSKYLICEFTEFNLQRYSVSPSTPSIMTPNPQLSQNGFDKHEDMIRQALSKLGDINRSMLGANSYKYLKSTLSLEEQDIKELKIIRIVKLTNFNYDVYINFKILDKFYWGVVKDILLNPDLKSEVFKDVDLIQTKEWTVRTRGVILKSIKNWLKPQFGFFQQIVDDVICYSNETGEMLKLKKGAIVEVLKSYDDRIIFKYEGDQYTLKGDNFVYFNYWFDPTKEELD